MADHSVRSKMAAASRRIARLKRIDRAAVFVITLGGLAVVVGVLGILLFIGAEALPLFRSADVGVPAAVPVSVLRADEMRAVGVDEYRIYLFRVEPDGRLVFYSLTDGREALAFPMPGLEPGTAVLSSSRASTGNYVAAGTADGRVSLTQVRYTPRYENQQLSGIEIRVVDRGLAEVDAAGRPVRQVSYLEVEGRRHVAAVLSDTEIALWRTEENGDVRSAIVRVQSGQRVGHVRVGAHGAIVASTDTGHLYHWLFDAGDDEPRLTDEVAASSTPITALEFLIGGTSIVVGNAAGEVSSWFRAAHEDGSERFLKAHTYGVQPAAVAGFAPSPRDRSFAATGSDGSLVVRHQTSERMLASQPRARAGAHVVMAPKADAIYACGSDGCLVFDMANPHPEVSWRALFGKVWYEGYAEPEYVWQSTGATDEFEPKLSLVPLIFGTIKGTLYAMLFAVPLSILAALYTSQFVHPAIKAKIKPTVEIMAALPSVVIGFIAGLYLASAVEKNLIGVFVMFLLLPVFGTSGVLLWRLLPRAVSHRLRAGMEVLLILPLVMAGAWVSIAVGPSVESWLFAGDARAWLQSAFGLTYDQRNCLVVGMAMGFAVIPIIFTIAEDAFTSVPPSLTAASLAVGASRWQTAIRVVLPTASPGIFSAVMIGFGRAVGETMIVLMATGNTPIMEWSIFNGIRTLSANIAVEIPEAPYGGTLYRTLFLAAAVLFLMTFFINTVAEVIRQRLRERYRAI